MVMAYCILLGMADSRALLEWGHGNEIKVLYVLRPIVPANLLCDFRRNVNQRIYW
jgi:hypothetical protein